MNKYEWLQKREAKRAYEEWQRAKALLNDIIDPPLIEYAVYYAEAARKKYVYLIEQLKELEETKENA